MNKILTFDEYQARIGQELGTSDWLIIDQDRINQFADATDDHQFIHVDPKQAKDTVFGGTIAHGYLTLSMLSKFSGETFPMIEGVVMGINYGLNKVRFLNPVKEGQQIRAQFVLKDVVEKKAGQYLFTTDVVIEIKGEKTPACVIEWLSLAITGEHKN